MSCWTCFHREWLGPASAQARLEEKQKSLEQDLQQKEQSAGVLSHPRLNNSVCFGIFRDISGYFGIPYLTMWLWWFERTEWTRYFQPFSAQPQIKPYAEILNLQQHRLEDGERIQAMQQEMAEAMGGLLGSLGISCYFWDVLHCFADFWIQPGTGTWHPQMFPFVPARLNWKS